MRARLREAVVGHEGKNAFGTWGRERYSLASAMVRIGTVGEVRVVYNCAREVGEV